jgi:TatD DNase family protein
MTSDTKEGNGICVDSHRHLSPEDFDAVGDSSMVFATGPTTDWELIMQVDDGRKSRDASGVVGFGYHPWYLDEASDLVAGGTQWLEKLRAVLKERPDAFVGEIGLDKVKGPDMETQLKAFEAQLDIAVEFGRPVSVHCVRSWGPMLTLLTKRPATALPPAFLFHGFTGSTEFVNSLMKMPKKKATKFYFGVSASTTAKLKDFEHVVAMIPEDRILIESDAHTSDEAVTLMAEIAEHLKRVRPEAVKSCNENARALAQMLRG